MAALLAGILATRSKSWWQIALFAVIGIGMAIVAIFGIAVSRFGEGWSGVSVDRS